MVNTDISINKKQCVTSYPDVSLVVATSFRIYSVWSCGKPLAVSTGLVTFRKIMDMIRGRVGEGDLFCININISIMLPIICRRHRIYTYMYTYITYIDYREIPRQ